LPPLFSSSLKSFQQVSFPIFIQVYKVHWPYLLSFTLSIHPPPSYLSSPHNRTCFTFPSFIFRCFIFIVQRGFTMVFHLWLYNTLTTLTFLLLSLPLSPIPYFSTAFNALCYSYTDAMHFSIIHSLSFSFSLLIPLIPSNSDTIADIITHTHTYKYMYHTHIHIYIYIYIYIYIFILIHVLVLGHLGYFHRLTIINSATIKIGAQVFLLYPDLHSFTYIPRSGITGS
jgi:hypothetical protein